MVWLDAAEHEWVEEMGGMNLYFVYGSGAGARIMTPALTGTLLPGHHQGLAAQARTDAGHPRRRKDGSRCPTGAQDCAAGELTEVFACGTAAVVTPVGAVDGPSGGWTIGSAEPGPVTMRLREELIGIQYGHRPDPFGWVHKVA